MELNQLTAHELLDLLKKKKISPKQILESVLNRIKNVDKKIKSFVFFNESVLEAKNLKFDENKKLSGIPIAIKDNICTKSEPTTCASKILSNFISPYDATVIKKLKKEGAILVGRTNMDEFAFGSSCENSAYFPTKNPWDLNRVPGGSSGGSAAAVACDETILALGSDTGGSIREPASFCGVVGLKPSYGRVSRYGLIAFASSLDQIGPITKDVEDAALLLEVISGKDNKDSTSVSEKVLPYSELIKKENKVFKIAYPKECFQKGVSLKIKESFNKAIKTFEKLNIKVEEISLSTLEYAISCYYIISSAEASSNLSRYDGIRYGLREKAKTLKELYEKTRSKGFGKEAKRRIILGTYVLSAGYYEAYYLKAQKVRNLIKKEFDKIFEKYPLIIMPTTPFSAFKLGEKISDPISMYLSDIFTVPANLAGLPAISIPMGFEKINGKDLPLGLQIIGKQFDELNVLKLAYLFEKSTDYHFKKPKL